MELRLVRKFAELMNDQGLQTLEVIDSTLAIRLERDGSTPNLRPLQERVTITKERTPATKAKSTSAPKAQQTTTTKIFEIRSPLVGTFLSHSGGSDFVSMGARVEKGDVLCLIKAGEQLHEITSDIEGEVIEVLARHKTDITFDQIMFKVVSK